MRSFKRFIGVNTPQCTVYCYNDNYFSMRYMYAVAGGNYFL